MLRSGPPLNRSAADQTYAATWVISILASIEGQEAM
jgi:hypothetical protein